MSRPALGFTPVHIAYHYHHKDRPKMAAWDGKEKRCPRKGELYLSGCRGYEKAYEAPNDLDSEYFIAVPLAGRA